MAAGQRIGVLQFWKAAGNPYPAMLSPVILTMASTAVGWASWGGTESLASLLLLPLVPLLWGAAKSRGEAGVVMLVYFLAGSRGLPGGAGVFFGDSAPGWWGWAMWCGASLILSLPFTLLWSRSAQIRAWLFVGASIAVLVPPIGLIGWINPLAWSGVMFPGLGWLGLGLGVLGIAAAAARIGSAFCLVAAIGIVVNGAWWNFPKMSDQAWRGVDTEFSGLASGNGDTAASVLAARERVFWLRRFAGSVPDRSVVVLPETILGQWSALTEITLSSVEEQLREKGARVLVGAEVPQEDGRYINGLVVLGASASEPRVLPQGVPVPISMWRPWGEGGAVADVFGNRVHGVAGLRAATLICYDQLLPFSALWAMRHRPDVMLAPANLWWARGTSIPAVQVQTLDTYARLFGVPVLRARNF